MIGDKIKSIRAAYGVSQKQLSEMLHVTQGAVSQWEKGRTTPDFEMLYKICKIFNVRLESITNETNDEYFDGMIRMNKNAIPIIGEIACGTPITAEQNIEGYTDLPAGIRADFALRCKGESMHPTFLDGDLVLIRKSEDVIDGQIAVVLIDGEATLKHVYHQKAGLMLVADNPAYAPLMVSDCKIQGKAVGYVRLFGD